jgi:hypothetical protein
MQSKIEQLIITAGQQETQTNSLSTQLCAQIESLPSSISLAKSDPVRSLKNFVIEYITHVPPFIGAVSIAAKDAGIDAYVSPFLEVATDFLLSPKGQGNEPLGFLALLEQAYLTHRLIEEVNDQYIIRAGIPFIPMDVTKANVIVYHLLGEALANNLDEVVEETARQMTPQSIVYSSEKFRQYVEMRKGQGWDQVWKQWADMTNGLDIDLSLSENPND